MNGWQQIPVSSIFMVLLVSIGSVHGQEKQGPKKGIDPATVAAYAKFGAVYGGWVNNETDTFFQLGSANAETGIPGFGIRLSPKSKLPEVAVPFGLYFPSVNLTEQDLTQLAAVPGKLQS